MSLSIKIELKTLNIIQFSLFIHSLNIFLTFYIQPFSFAFFQALNRFSAFNLSIILDV